MCTYIIFLPLSNRWPTPAASWVKRTIIKSTSFLSRFPIASRKVVLHVSEICMIHIFSVNCWHYLLRTVLFRAVPSLFQMPGELNSCTILFISVLSNYDWWDIVGSTYSFFPFLQQCMYYRCQRDVLNVILQDSNSTEVLKTIQFAKERWLMILQPPIQIPTPDHTVFNLDLIQ